MKTPSKNIKDGSIYFLFDEDTLVYVGQSKNPCSRIGSHNRDKTFTHYRIMACLKRRMNYWESLLNSRYKPRYNKAGLKKSLLQRKLINAKPGTLDDLKGLASSANVGIGLKSGSRTSGRVKFSHPPKASSGLRFEEGWAIGYEPQVEPYIHLSRKNLQKIIYGRVKHD